MKKALSVLLAVLVLFSMAGVMATAEGETTETVRVVFYVDDAEYYALNVLPGVNFVDRLQTGDNVLTAPTKASTETTEYIFNGWELYQQNENGEWVATGVVDYPGTIPPVGEDVTEVRYVATFIEEDIKENQTLWAFIATIFERINMIFEYFAEVFRGVIDF